MPDKPRNQFERKCKVCDQYGVPTADGRILHYGRIAPCRENVVVEGVVDGAQVVADGVEAATSTIHTPGIVQGTYGKSGRFGIIASRKAGKTAVGEREVAELRAQGINAGIITPNPDQ